MQSDIRLRGRLHGRTCASWRALTSLGDVIDVWESGDDWSRQGRAADETKTRREHTTWWRKAKLHGTLLSSCFATAEFLLMQLARFGACVVPVFSQPSGSAQTRLPALI